MKIGSLFAGIGGFDLAARWMGWTTAWYSEIDPYASAVMAKQFPGVPNLGDIRHIDGRQAPPVDILCGGFPCQDISLAGRGAGIAGERSGLWKEYARLIGEIRPPYVVAENVSALRSRGLDVVLKDLSALGYDAEWHCIPAAAVGAPHRRDRIWIIAYPMANANSDIGDARRGGDAGEGTRGRNADRSCVGTYLLADSACQLPHGTGPTGAGRGTEPANGSWWLVEPDVGRVANGVPSRVDRLRCLGNAIVPQVAFAIFQAIEQRHRLVAAVGLAGPRT